MCNNILICPFCGRNNFKRKEGLTVHIRVCKNNPDRVEAKVKGVSKNKGDKNPMYGKSHSLTTKAKMSESNKAFWDNLSEDEKIIKTKILDAARLKLLSNLTEERKLEIYTKIRQALLNKSEEEKLEIANKKRRTWNDKSAEYQQQVNNQRRNAINNKSEEEKLEILNKISIALKNKSEEEKCEIANKKRRKWETKNDIEITNIQNRIYKTKKQNNTFRTSKIEEQLKNYFDSNNIEYIYQYKSDKYPFCCDFYFPSYDLYVEIQGHWSHGSQPYDASDEKCINKLKKWSTKNTIYYKNAIETWTERDVRKRNYAKEHCLNWIEIFSTNLNICIKQIENSWRTYSR